MLNGLEVSTLSRRLFTLLDLLPRRRGLMKLGREQFIDLLAEGLLDKPAGVTTFTAGEALGLDASLAVGGHDDFDGPAHTAPPT